MVSFRLSCFPAAAMPVVFFVSADHQSLCLFWAHLHLIYFSSNETPQSLVCENPRNFCFGFLLQPQGLQWSGRVVFVPLSQKSWSLRPRFVQQAQFQLPRVPKLSLLQALSWHLIFYWSLWPLVLLLATYYIVAIV